MNRLLFLFLALIALACEEPLENPFELFTIPKGEHYPKSRNPELLQSVSLKFQAKFDSTARYTLPAAFQDSKNKLMGFSDANSTHHQNSARFGWQWLHNQLEIYAYCYVDGERKEVFLGTVNINEINTYEILITPSAYQFRFKDTITEISRSERSSVGVYYILWPYFGGQLPAPHDINVAIRRFF